MDDAEKAADRAVTAKSYHVCKQAEDLDFAGLIPDSVAAY